MFTVYILYSKTSDKYYIGHTASMEDRLERHNQGRSISTKSGKPWMLVHTESFPSKSEAYQREMIIKSKKSRKYIESLFAG